VLVAGDADFVPAAKLGREHAHSLTANMARDLLQSLKDELAILAERERLRHWMAKHTPAHRENE
jgi:hypothetical protein